MAELFIEKALSGSDDSLLLHSNTETQASAKTPTILILSELSGEQVAAGHSCPVNVFRGTAPAELRAESINRTPSIVRCDLFFGGQPLGLQHLLELVDLPGERVLNVNYVKGNNLVTDEHLAHAQVLECAVTWDSRALLKFKIDTYRKQNNLQSDVKVAEAIGISASALSRHKNEDLAFYSRTWARIRYTLGITKEEEQGINNFRLLGLDAEERTRLKSDLLKCIHDLRQRLQSSSFDDDQILDEAYRAHPELSQLSRDLLSPVIRELRSEEGLEDPRESLYQEIRALHRELTTLHEPAIRETFRHQQIGNMFEALAILTQQLAGNLCCPQYCLSVSRDGLGNVIHTTDIVDLVILRQQDLPYLERTILERGVALGTHRRIAEGTWRCSVDNAENPTEVREEYFDRRDWNKPALVISRKANVHDRILASCSLILPPRDVTPETQCIIDYGRWATYERIADGERAMIQVHSCLQSQRSTPSIRDFRNGPQIPTGGREHTEIADRWDSLRPFTLVEVKKGATRHVGGILAQLARQREAVEVHQKKSPWSLPALISHTSLLVLHDNPALMDAVHAANRIDPRFEYVHFNAPQSLGADLNDFLETRTLEEAIILKKLFEQLNAYLLDSPGLRPIDEMTALLHSGQSKCVPPAHTEVLFGDQQCASVVDLRSINDGTDEEIRWDEIEQRIGNLPPESDFLQFYRKVAEAKVACLERGEGTQAELEAYRSRKLAEGVQDIFSSSGRVKEVKDFIPHIVHFLRSGRARNSDSIGALVESKLPKLTTMRTKVSGATIVYEERAGKLHQFHRAFRNSRVTVELPRAIQAIVARYPDLAIDIESAESLRTFVTHLRIQLETKRNVLMAAQLKESQFKAGILGIRFPEVNREAESRSVERFSRYTVLQGGIVSRLRAFVRGEELDQMEVQSELVLLSFFGMFGAAWPEKNYHPLWSQVRAALKFRDDKPSRNAESLAQADVTLTNIGSEILSISATQSNVGYRTKLVEWRSNLLSLESVLANNFDLEAGRASGLCRNECEMHASSILTRALNDVLPSFLNDTKTMQDMEDFGETRKQLILQQAGVLNGSNINSGSLLRILHSNAGIVAQAKLPLTPERFAEISEKVRGSLLKWISHDQMPRRIAETLGCAAITAFGGIEERVVFTEFSKIVDRGIALCDIDEHLAQDYVEGSVKAFLEFPDIYSDHFLEKIKLLHHHLTPPLMTGCLEYLQQRPGTARAENGAELMKRLCVIAFNEHDFIDPLKISPTQEDFLDAIERRDFDTAEEIETRGRGSILGAMKRVLSIESRDPHLRWARRSSIMRRDSSDSMEDLEDTFSAEFAAIISKAMAALTAQAGPRPAPVNLEAPPFSTDKRMKEVCRMLLDNARSFARSSPQRAGEYGIPFLIDKYKGLRCYAEQLSGLIYLAHRNVVTEICNAYFHSPVKLFAWCEYSPIGKSSPRFKRR